MYQSNEPARCGEPDDVTKALALQPFMFDESIRVRAAQIDGEPWLVAHDVAKALGYSNTADAIAKHCKAKTTIAKRDGGFMTLIPERDVYRLVMRSKLPSAERFEEWVVGEVLPSIRRTGSYSMAPQKPADSLDVLAGVVNALRDERDARLRAEARVSVAENAIAEIRGTLHHFTSNALANAPKKVLAGIPNGQMNLTQIQEVGRTVYGLADDISWWLVNKSPWTLSPSNTVRGIYSAPTPQDPEHKKEGAPFAVYFEKDVNALFAVFVHECERVTPFFVKHDLLPGQRFRLKPGYAKGETVEAADVREHAERIADGR
ncbi:Bro-N domain-containing protein [Paraburkholderia sp. A1RO-5L]|uniref:BRO-N domain-containing protein n=1 Tax=Paraburkholderia sp. A1RO-5L TaxID=3028370 RepID=UPI003B8135EB